MNAEHGDGTAKPFLRHIQQEQARDAAGIPSTVIRDEEVEAVVEAGGELLAGADLGGARSAVCAGEVVQ